MDVPKNLPECVCFLCIEQGGKYVPKATAFFVSVPADLGPAAGVHVYLVTARHCVEKVKRYGSLFVRLNVRPHRISGDQRRMEV
jgi:hypothetical protein